jgi:hypothetical protein
MPSFKLIDPLGLDQEFLKNNQVFDGYHNFHYHYNEAA